MYKNEEDFEKLLKYCVDNIGKCFGMGITETEVTLSGVSSSVIKPATALMIFKKDGDVIISGLFENKPINYSSILEFKPDHIVVGVDGKKDKKIKVFYRITDTTNKISSKSVMNPGDMVLIYWETQDVACLTFCSSDSDRQKTVREIVWADNKSMMAFLRGVVRQYLFLITPEDMSASVDNDNDKEE